MNNDKYTIFGITWTLVRVDELNESTKKLFVSRRQAIRDKILKYPISDICSTHGISESELYRVYDRSQIRLPNGMLAGDLACLPFCRLLEEIPKCIDLSIDFGKGDLLKKQLRSKQKGTFKRLLLCFPKIKQDLDQFILKGLPDVQSRKLLSKHFNKRRTKIHQYFVKLCKEYAKNTQVEIYDETCWPFNVESMGYRTICSYVNNILEWAEDFEIGSQTTAENISKTGRDTDKFVRSLCGPMELELDAHRIDAYFVHEWIEHGETHRLVISRIWLLALVSRRTRAVSAYSVVIGEQYTNADVQDLVWRAIAQPDVKDFKHEVMSNEFYVNRGTAEIPDVIYSDNAMSHIAKDGRITFIDKLGVHFCLGSPGEPNSRPFVERFFGIFEENGFHLIRSTTGSSKDDPVRDDSEQKALELGITTNDACRIASEVVNWYQKRPHSSLKAESPYEYATRLINSGTLTTLAPPELQSRGAICILRAEANVKGDRARGHTRHINAFGDKYYGSCITSKKMGEIAIVLTIEPDDARFAKVYDGVTGQFIGDVTVGGDWKHTKHSIYLRRLIKSETRRKRFKYRAGEDPVLKWLEHKKTEGVSSKKAATQAAKAEAGKDHEKKSVNNHSKSEVKIKPLFDFGDLAA